jgi:hypothetical protein
MPDNPHRPLSRTECPEKGKPHERIVSRDTTYHIFDPDGSDRIFFCEACGNIFPPTPAEKQNIQRGLAQGTH